MPRGLSIWGMSQASADNRNVKALTVAPRIEELEQQLRPWREQLAQHPLYEAIESVEDVQVFMESHVFAVWDFMSLLKSLQRTLTCVDIPWVPSRFPASRRFINEIVLGEESDMYSGRPYSHFEIYLEAMEAAGADTGSIRRLIDGISRDGRKLPLEHAPSAAKAFVESTFQVIGHGSAAEQAAAFAFGREDAIPEMFRALVKRLNQESSGRLEMFTWYLERHIEVDGDDHGPLALGMVSDLCGEDAALWGAAQKAAVDALRARVQLWDGVLAEIEARRSTR